MDFSEMITDEVLRSYSSLRWPWSPVVATSGAAGSVNPTSDMPSQARVNPPAPLIAPNPGPTPVRLVQPPQPREHSHTPSSPTRLLLHPLPVVSQDVQQLTPPDRLCLLQHPLIALFPSPTMPPRLSPSLTRDRRPPLPSNTCRRMSPPAVRPGSSASLVDSLLDYPPLPSPRAAHPLRSSKSARTFYSDTSSRLLPGSVFNMVPTF